MDSLILKVFSNHPVDLSSGLLSFLSVASCVRPGRGNEGRRPRAGSLSYKRWEEQVSIHTPCCQSPSPSPCLYPGPSLPGPALSWGPTEMSSPWFALPRNPSSPQPARELQPLILLLFCKHFSPLAELNLSRSVFLPYLFFLAESA